MQATARNMLRSWMPDEMADDLDQKVLGDYEGGYRHPQPTKSGVGAAASGLGGLMQTPEAPLPVQPTTQLQLQKPLLTNNKEVADWVQLLAQAKGK